jgi:hypothetical protein
VIFHPPASLSQFEGPYLVSRLFPLTDSGPSYQIASVRDGHERVAFERELAPPGLTEALKSPRRHKTARQR